MAFADEEPEGDDGDPGEADGGDGASKPDKPSGGNQGGSSGGSSSGSKDKDKDDPKPEKETPYIKDVAVVLADTDQALGYASKGHSTKDGSINKKGGKLELDSIVWWNDGSAERNSSKVHWVCEDDDVATISGGGVVSAQSNGTATVKAIVDSSTKNGATLTAVAKVKVTNQESACYVSKIQILTPDGKSAKSYELVEDMATAQLQLTAKVTVVDQESGAKSTVETKGSLADFGLSNLAWSINDENIGTVSPETGAYRPKAYTAATITASSRAGLDGETVSASIEIVTKDPEGGEVVNDRHPQDSLTVKAYWETPPEGTTEENKYVIDKTYSIADLQSMAVKEITYTAIGGNGGSDGYYTMSGRGVLLSEVLKDAGVDIKGMKSISFGTHDKINKTVSASFVFDTDRFYYPNIDVNSGSGKVQVAPMIAFASSEVKSGSTAPDYDNLSDNTRFRLLFGAKRDGSNNSQYQIKWIHTLYVKLKGGPKVEHGSGEADSGDGKQDGDQSQSGTDGEGQGAGGADKGAGKGSQGADAGGKASGSAGASVSSEGSKSKGGSNGNAAEASQAGGGYKVYQVMSRYHSKTDTQVDYDNPFAPFAGPVGAAVVISGALESALWFRRQTMVVGLATNA